MDIQQKIEPICKILLESPNSIETKIWERNTLQTQMSKKIQSRSTINLTKWFYAES